MTLAVLKNRIQSKEAKMAVIGLGYVGLPVAACFAEIGFNVLGVDLVEDRVDRINRGQSPIEGNEPGLEELIVKVTKSKKLVATTDYTKLKDRDVSIICVETPIDDQHQPRYEALRTVLDGLGKQLKEGALVIVESTISPGTMENLVKPSLEKSSNKKLNQGFYLGNCPERVMPGKLLANLHNMSRVVGGMSLETAEVMVELYRYIVHGDLDVANSITAELVKTVENAYRDVQIAFANEVAMISEAVGGDVWKVRELVNKSPGRNMLLPGAGVGGHCIPKDPWLLAFDHEKANELRVIPAARIINDGMPSHVLNLLERALNKQGKQLNGSRVLILGYAYLEDSDDTRNSPSEAFIQVAKAKGLTVQVHDPFVEKFKGDVYEIVKHCDAVVLLVKHSEYGQIDFGKLRAVMNTPVLLDARGFFNPEKLRQAGFEYFRLGSSYTE